MSLKGVGMYMYATNFIPKQIIVTSHVVVPGIWMQKNNSVHNFSISHNETLWISIKKQWATKYKNLQKNQGELLGPQIHKILHLHVAVKVS